MSSGKPLNTPRTAYKRAWYQALESAWETVEGIPDGGSRWGALEVYKSLAARAPHDVVRRFVAAWKRGNS